MRYYLNLNASLLGTVAIAAVATIAIVQPAALALEPEQIGQIAKYVTVRIETPGDDGSGVIIKKDGNTYTVLTAHHVIASIKGNEEAYVIPEATRQMYRIDNSSIRSLPNGVDLAIFQFQSDRNYRTARLGNSNTINLSQASYVSGYPMQKVSTTTLQFRSGMITGIEQSPLAGGYQIFYDNNTQAGMSGGPVFNIEGEVIGIHGKGDRNDQGEKTGTNAAVPINTYRDWLDGNEQNQNVAVNTTQIPMDAKAYHDRGVDYAEGKEYRQAIADFDRSIELQPDASTYNNRGNAYVALENYRQAITDFDRAIQIDPNFAFPYYNRGNAYGKLEDYSQAIAAFDQTIRLQPDFADAYINRGLAYFKLGDCQSAIKNFDQALEITPGNEQIQDNRANVRSRLNTSECRSR